MLRGRVGVAVVLDSAQELELLIGPGAKPSRFRDEDERETAWEAHRDDLLEKCPAGRRPWGWWRFACPKPWGSWHWERSGKPCAPVHQAAVLVELGVVDEAELRKVRHQWDRDDVTAHLEARRAASVNHVDFDEALLANRELRGIPGDRPVLERPAITTPAADSPPL
jgi:hypothetical protein